MVKTWLTLSFLAAVAAPAAQAFVPAAQMPEIARAPALRSASVLMCLPPAGVRPAAASANPLAKQALAAFSALCISGAVGPASARARELSAEVLAAQAGDTVALVAEAAPEAPVKGGDILKKGGIAVAAGAAGFGSVLLLRKGGKKDSVQEWADGKQKEWKVRVFFEPQSERVNTVNDSYNIGVCDDTEFVTLGGLVVGSWA